jgi:hypothetical protein
MPTRQELPGQAGRIRLTSRKERGYSHSRQGLDS